MQITERIHALKIPFKVPVSPEVSIDRFAFAYLIFGESIHLIDSGVANANTLILDYILSQSRDPQSISTLILTHTHPDHIGSAKSIKSRTDCTVYAHQSEQDWVEDTEKQFRERPVPGFQTLVEGPVKVDRFIEDGETLKLEPGLACKVIHTPGHSRGSISLLFEEEKALFTGDALAFPGDLPIYDDISTCLKSIEKLQQIENVEILFSSWEAPIQGHDQIRRRMDESIAYLKRIHTAVIACSQDEEPDMMELCKRVVGELGLPPSAATPLVAYSFKSSLSTKKDEKLFKS